MKKNGPGGRILIGMFLLLFGVIFLVDSYTDWEIPSGTLWPVFPLVAGLLLVLRRGARWIGVVLVVVGGIPLLNALGVWTLDLSDIWRLWPVILIVVGVRIIFGRRRSGKTQDDSPGHAVTASGTDSVEINAVFGTEKRLAGSSFSDGRVTAIFGEANLDMRRAELAGEEVSVDAVALFGSVKLRIPSGWTVDLRTTNVFGSSEDQRSDQRSDQPSDQPMSSGNRVVVTGLCMFGSLEVHS